MNSSIKNKLLIYNFITTDNYDNTEMKDVNYDYYSIIIPQTISKTLNKTGNYDIMNENGPFSIGSDFKDSIQKIKYLKKLEELGSQYKSDYIITGTFNVINNKLSIRITIFNVKGKGIEVVTHESDELGVQLQKTTDLISQRLIENIEKLNTINQRKITISPFITFYNSLNFITLGVESGYLYILGDWSKLYNNTPYVSPYMDFNLTDNLLLSAKIASIQSDSENSNNQSSSGIRILSSSLSICYAYKLTSSLGISISAGGGVTKTSVIIGSSQPFKNPLSEKNSLDPNVDISSHFFYNISTITFNTGVLYKRIFYTDKPMETCIIFAGAGIHF